LWRAYPTVPGVTLTWGVKLINKINFFTYRYLQANSYVLTVCVFGEANIALTRWVEEGSIFILIRVAHALAK